MWLKNQHLFLRDCQNILFYPELFCKYFMIINNPAAWNIGHIFWTRLRNIGDKVPYVYYIDFLETFFHILFQRTQREFQKWISWPNILMQMYFVYLEIIINFIIFKSKLDFIQDTFYFSSCVSSEMNFKSKMHGIFVFWNILLLYVWFLMLESPRSKHKSHVTFALYSKSTLLRNVS